MSITIKRTFGKGLALSLIMIFAIFSAANGRETVGLVLSGGGAKGIAHVGVIKALEDNDIPIDYVTGTSMGAIVGSLYSCGWNPEQMMNLFTSEGFHYWSTGTINRNLVYYIETPNPTPRWLSINLNFKDSTDNNILQQIIPSSLINPVPMNLEFLELYSPYTEQCDENFNNLFVPFRCVTSDIYHKHKIVCKSGSLGDAVRASMSFPLVFKPIEMDGVLVYDGGIYDNFPVDVMQQDFNPDFIIGVSVSSADTKPIKGDVYSQLEDMIIQNNDYNLPAEDGVKIQVPVLNFGVLDFPQAKEIYSIGYKTGLEMVDSIKKRLPARVSLEEVNERRAKFASKTPEVLFDTVKVTGTTPRQAKYIDYLFEGKKPGEAITLPEVKNAYYRAMTDGKLYDLLPQAKFNSDGKNVLELEASVKKPWNVGVGGWITSSTNSMLYLTFGYHTLNLNSLDVDLGGWLGQSYYAGQLRARFALKTAVPSYMEIEGVINSQKYYDSELLFYESNTPSFITDSQLFARLGYSWALGRPAKGFVSFTYGREKNQFFPYDKEIEVSLPKNHMRYDIAAIKVGAELNTLNDFLYPSLGKEWQANVIMSHENMLYKPENDVKREERINDHLTLSAELIWKHYFPLHNNFRLGAMVHGLATFEHLDRDYTATMIHCPGFEPTPSTRNYFNIAFRSNNFVAAGLMPVWAPFNHAQLRGDFYYYTPIRNIEPDAEGLAHFDGWFRKPQFIGELAAVYNFRFASLSLYVNYLSSPKHNWNFGINFGLFFQAPRLLR